MARQQTRLDLLIGNLRSGLFLGAGAYLLGSLLTFLFMVMDNTLSAESGVSTWKLVGWTFYGLHHVPIETSTNGLYGARGRSVQMFSDSSLYVSPLADTVPAFVYELVPVVLLISAGYLVYRRSNARIIGRPLAAVLGSVVIVGYLLLSVVGQYFVTGASLLTLVGIGRNVAAGPVLTTSVLRMGIFYPLIFGGIGGMLAERRCRNAEQGTEGARRSHSHTFSRW